MEKLTNKMGQRDNYEQGLSNFNHSTVARINISPWFHGLANFIHPLLTNWYALKFLPRLVGASTWNFMRFLCKNYTTFLYFDSPNLERTPSFPGNSWFGGFSFD